MSKDQTVIEKTISDCEWNINYHEKKLKEHKILLEVLMKSEYVTTNTD